MSSGQALYALISALISLLFPPLVEFVKHRLQQYLAKKKLLLKSLDIKTVLVGQLDMLASTLKSRSIFTLEEFTQDIFAEKRQGYDVALDFLSSLLRRKVISGSIQLYSFYHKLK
ncbi:hypothetical protein C4K10_0822 [Pseudomonas chlororaphis subsp. aureofaciens]|uniref:hypothetical protein n=1 Tax=Pseudomonas chlororaphis TaxID=587753 RepID=UPI000F581C92|nr:hypothetical protein [Pseudomonas chlororaphis]AZE09124.1 hypothetical protein C4K10_0822 [Pseudomonas chlororaphis subsp. aureofaciens]